MIANMRQFSTTNDKEARKRANEMYECSEIDRQIT